MTIKIPYVILRHLPGIAFWHEITLDKEVHCNLKEENREMKERKINKIGRNVKDKLSFPIANRFLDKITSRIVGRILRRLPNQIHNREVIFSSLADLANIDKAGERLRFSIDIFNYVVKENKTKLNTQKKRIFKAINTEEERIVNMLVKFKLAPERIITDKSNKAYMEAGIVG